MTFWRSRIVPPQEPIDRAPDTPVNPSAPSAWDAQWDWPLGRRIPFDVEATDWLEDGFPPPYEPPRGAQR